MGNPAFGEVMDFLGPDFERDYLGRGEDIGEDQVAVFCEGGFLRE